MFSQLSNTLFLDKKMIEFENNVITSLFGPRTYLVHIYIYIYIYIYMHKLTHGRCIYILLNTRKNILTTERKLILK